MFEKVLVSKTPPTDIFLKKFLYLTIVCSFVNVYTIIKVLKLSVFNHCFFYDRDKI